MFKYPIEQKSYKIGKYTIGGHPTKIPVALAGTIFYLNQKKIFIDEEKGQINKEYAEKLIKDQEELADQTGLTPLLDVVTSFEGSIQPILDFVFDTTDSPILVDAPYWEVKEPLLKYLIDTGLDKKVIYNSITSSSFDEEFELLSKTNIENFFLMPIESRFWTTKARMDILDSLIEKAKSFNLKKNNFLVDTCVIEYTSLGLAMNAIEQVKMKYGYPAGTAGQNLADAWKRLVPNFGNIKKYVKVAGALMPLSVGADFLFYGPIQLSEIVFPIAEFIKEGYYKLSEDK